MMHHFNQHYRGRSIEVVIEPSAHGCEAWFLVDGMARCVPKTLHGLDVEAAIAATLRAAREWVDRRPRAAALHAMPALGVLSKYAAPQPWLPFP